MSSMYKGDDFDRLLSEAIDDKPRQRRAETAAMLRSLAAALESRTAARAGVVKSFGDAADRLAKAGKTPRQVRAELAEYEGDYDGADERDKAAGQWLQNLQSLPAALEPTVHAVISAVVGCDSTEAAIRDVKKAFANDRKIDLGRAKSLIAAYPLYR